jgi:hypothetical protein
MTACAYRNKKRDATFPRRTYRAKKSRLQNFFQHFQTMHSDAQPFFVDGPPSPPHNALTKFGSTVQGTSRAFVSLAT